MRLRHSLLLLEIVCCAVAAVVPMTIWVFPFRSRGWLLESLLALAAVVGLLGLIAYACSLARERGVWPRSMLVGIASAAVSAVLFAAFATYEGYEIIATRGTYGILDHIMYEYLRPGAMTTLLAAALAGQWSALSLLRLDRPEHRQYRSIARYAGVLYVCTMGFIVWGGALDLVIVIPLAAVVMHAILLWAYFNLRRRSPHARYVSNYIGLAYAGILAVLFAWGGWIDPIVQWSYNRSTFGPSIDREIASCATITILAVTAIVPILAMLETLSRSDRGAQLVKTEKFGGICVHCGTKQEMRIGRNRCTGCGIVITINIEEPRCDCGYLLYQLQRETCPECGRKISELPSMATRSDPQR